MFSYVLIFYLGTAQGELKGLLGSNGQVVANVGFTYENTSEKGLTSYSTSIFV